MELPRDTSRFHDWRDARIVVTCANGVDEWWWATHSRTGIECYASVVEWRSFVAIWSVKQHRCGSLNIASIDCILGDDSWHESCDAVSWKCQQQHWRRSWCFGSRNMRCKFMRERRKHHPKILGMWEREVSATVAQRKSEKVRGISCGWIWLN